MLLPCPLCGGAAAHSRTMGYYGSEAIVCEDCSLTLEYGLYPGDKTRAEQAWNTRIKKSVRNISNSK